MIWQVASGLDAGKPVVDYLLGRGTTAHLSSASSIGSIGWGIIGQERTLGNIEMPIFPLLPLRISLSQQTTPAKTTELTMDACSPPSAHAVTETSKPQTLPTTLFIKYHTPPRNFRTSGRPLKVEVVVDPSKVPLASRVAPLAVPVTQATRGWVPRASQRLRVL